MMYGFGDDQNPYSESVDMLEDLVIEFITEMVYLLLFVAKFLFVFINISLYLVYIMQCKKYTYIAKVIRASGCHST